MRGRFLDSEQDIQEVLDSIELVEKDDMYLLRTKGFARVDARRFQVDRK